MYVSARDIGTNEIGGADVARCHASPYGALPSITARASFAFSAARRLIPNLLLLFNSSLSLHSPIILRRTIFEQADHVSFGTITHI